MKFGHLKFVKCLTILEQKVCVCVRCAFATLGKKELRKMHSQLPTYVRTYCIAGFFEGENFHESIAIRENFSLEIITKSIRHCVLLTRFVKISPSKSWIRAIHENFPPRKKPAIRYVPRLM